MDISKSRRHLAVVALFILAASLLVVLTTFAINMLTATGDFNRLLVKWSQNKSNSDLYLVQYLKTGDMEQEYNYLEAAENRMYTGEVITELMDENPNESLIFNEFDPDDIHPNEITGLIRIFKLFSGTDEVRNLKKTWDSIQNLVNHKQALTDSLLTSQYSFASQSETITELDQRNREINNHVRAMIDNNTAILIMLKRYSLWFTVLLGILIVLIGVIFTVRGVKQIQESERLLKERDYLAMFPELNQYPVLNVTSEGLVGFVNQAALSKFPNLKEQGIHHPFLKELKTHFQAIISKPGQTVLHKIEINGKYYQQASHYLSQEKGIHVHSIDITTLKEQQNKISRSLEEKNLLLAEVHHRVKNNMAVISSLLELQEMLGEDSSTALSESRSRIKSMAIVHELLYQSESVSEIDSEKYFQKIARHLELTLSNIDHIQINKTGYSPVLNINQAIPLGLLINELTFYLSLHTKSKQQLLNLVFEISDSEKQICFRMSSQNDQFTNPLFNKDDSLRMNLIKSLLGQLEGEVTVPETDPLNIKILFASTIKKGSSSSYL